MTPHPQMANFPTRRALIILGVGVLLMIVIGVLLRGLVESSAAQIIRLDGVVVQDNYTLRDQHDGNLVVFGNNTMLDAASRVTGSVSIVGESVMIAGDVSGSLTVIADTVNVAETANIGGNVSLLAEDMVFNGHAGGDVQGTGARLVIGDRATAGGIVYLCADDSRVSGDVRDQECDDRSRFAPFQSLLDLRDGSLVGSIIRSNEILSAGSLATALLNAFGFAAISALAVIIFPQHAQTISAALRRRPITLWIGGMALYGLGFGMVAGLIILLAIATPIGLLAIPIVLFAGFVFLLLWLVGMMAIAHAVGRRVLGRLGQEAPPVISAVVGAVVFSLALSLLAYLPLGYVFSLLAIILISAVGIGAAAFTRFGTVSG